MKKTLGEKAFQYFDILIMLLILAIIIFPFMNIISLSVSGRDAILSNSVSLWPKGFNLAAYGKILGSALFLRSLINTIGITVIGTFLAVILTLMVSYALTKDFLGKKFVTYYFLITMYFSGGLIPTYLVVTKYLNLRNTYWALILPYLVSVFYIIVMRSQIENIPSSIFDAAYIDGANEYQTVFQIVLPTIAPTIAAISMFFALGKWNSWFPVMIYTDYNKFWTLQYYLRVVVFSKFLGAKDNTELILEEAQIPEENFRMAAIVLVALPIVSIYPFVQKYFVKGIISGAVKG
ncbi:MAG TPA: carbohydrate ABC transporter permease [Clostridiales bacterium]|nr:carbohydrate ABC transporter permease [Clostridiales bacterium]